MAVCERSEVSTVTVQIVASVTFDRDWHGRGFILLIGSLTDCSKVGPFVNTFNYIKSLLESQDLSLTSAS